MAAQPDEVAAACDWPVFEADKHARHLRLVTERGRLTARLMADPDYCEPRLAGWWAWGACIWIGGGWCAGDGPWHAEACDDEGFPVLTCGDAGTGVKRQLPHLGDAGTGVKRQLPHLGDAGKGVVRQLPHLNAGRGVCSARRAHLREWFAELAEAFRGARIACGDWERICSPGTMTRNGICAVLLDPPYSQTEPVYAHDGREISACVREWCHANGANRQLRIALCGHAGEHEALEAVGWTVDTWEKRSGYQGADDRERIWFSPGCLRAEKTAQLELF